MYAIKFKNNAQVRYLIETRGSPEYNAIDSGNLEGARKWKTERGAVNYLQTKLLVGKQGEKLRTKWAEIEVAQISPQQQWHTNNPEVIRESKAKYNSKRPVLSFRPKPEILQWLQSEKQEGETDAELLNRKLGELMELESAKE